MKTTFLKNRDRELIESELLMFKNGMKKSGCQLRTNSLLL